VKELRTEIEINANSDIVWNVLIDFNKYDQWNPFIRKIIGEPIEGSRIDIFIETPGGKNRKYEPTVTTVNPELELRWLGKSWALNGEHIFSIEKIREGYVRFIQRELFGGLLTGFFGKSLDTDIRQGFEEMNKALKERAEHRTG